MQPVTLNGPPTYFNSSGSPSLAMRWAGNLATAVTSKYCGVEIGPATTSPRSFWVTSIYMGEAAAGNVEVGVYNTTVSKIETDGTVQQTNAANSTTEFGSVATNSIVRSGVCDTQPAATDSLYAFAADNSRHSNVVTPTPALFIPAGNYFSVIQRTANDGVGIWVQFAEIVKP